MTSDSFLYRSWVKNWPGFYWQVWCFWWITVVVKGNQIPNTSACLGLADLKVSSDTDRAWQTFPVSFLTFYHFSLHPLTVGLGGYGPIQPAYLHHLGDQFPHLPVALPQSQPLDVHAHQPRLPQPQWQAEGGMELKVTWMNLWSRWAWILTCYMTLMLPRGCLLQLGPKIHTDSQPTYFPWH